MAKNNCYGWCCSCRIIYIQTKHFLFHLSKSPSPYLPALLNTFLVTSLRACVRWCLSKYVNEIQYRNGTSGAFSKYFERRTSDQVRCVSNNQWRLHIGFSLPSFLCIKPANKVTHRTPLRTGYKVGGRNTATLSKPHWFRWHYCYIYCVKN